MRFEANSPDSPIWDDPPNWISRDQPAAWVPVALPETKSSSSRLPDSIPSPCMPLCELLPAAYRPVNHILPGKPSGVKPSKVTRPNSSDGAPPVVAATPAEIGMTSRDRSIPIRSLTLEAVWENHSLEPGSIPRKSRTQDSPAKTSSGPTSSPSSLRIRPPDPSTSRGMWTSQSLMVRGCLGMLPNPLSWIPAARASADPVPWPFVDEDQRPWCPSVARMTALAWIGLTSPVRMSSVMTPRTCWLSDTSCRGSVSERLCTPRLMACSSRTLVTSRTVESPQPVSLATLCPGAVDAWGSPPCLLRKTSPQRSSSASVETPSPQVLAAASLSVVSPPAAIVSSKCAEESNSSIDAAKPANGDAPDAEPMPDSSIISGTVPESAHAMAARRAAGPAPRTITSHDSNTIEPAQRT